MGKIILPDKTELELNGREGSVSDGYHTFDELYEHRLALTLALMLSQTGLPMSWRSLHHHPDGDPMFDGFFIVGMDLPTGVITYHYKLEYWHTFDGIKELDHAPLWDGHTPADVVARLMRWCEGRQEALAVA